MGQFQDARYVSASEALWRLSQFEIVDKQPAVVRLDVHLEIHHKVYFRERIFNSKLRIVRGPVPKSLNGLMQTASDTALVISSTPTSLAVSPETRDVNAGSRKQRFH